MSRSVKLKSDRIDLRVDDTAKELIEQAASITGMSVSTFTLSNTLRAARQEIAAFERLTLSNRDRDLFLSTMATSLKANEALHVAMKQYSKKYR